MKPAKLKAWCWKVLMEMVYSQNVKFNSKGEIVLAKPKKRRKHGTK